MNRQTVKELEREIRESNRLQTDALSRVPREKWPRNPGGRIAYPTEVWRSKEYVLQVYDIPEAPGVERLSISRAEIDVARTLLAGDQIHYTSGISWDRLQELKAECGRGDRCAVEVFPPDALLVNVANMRHLFVYPAGELPPFVWRGRPRVIQGKADA